MVNFIRSSSHGPETRISEELQSQNKILFVYNVHKPTSYRRGYGVALNSLCVLVWCFMFTSCSFYNCERNVIGVVDKPLVLKSMCHRFVAGLIICSWSLLGEIMGFMWD